jgi:predicted transcriptional regulator
MPVHQHRQPPVAELAEFFTASFIHHLSLAHLPVFPYLWVVKTTIELPDELFLKAKMLAAERRITLKEIMVQALSLFTQTPPEAEEKKRKAALKRLLKGMKAANTEPMAPLKRDEIYDR